MKAAKQRDTRLPAGAAGEGKRQLTSKKAGRRPAEKERCRPIPPSGQESPKISEGGAGPSIEAAFNGHGSGKFGRYQRNGDAQEQREDQKIDQAHSWTAGGDHQFQSEGAPGGVRKHHEDEIEQAGLADGGCRGWARDLHKKMAASVQQMR